MAQDDERAREQLAALAEQRAADGKGRGGLGQVAQEHEQGLGPAHRAVGVGQAGVAAAIVADIPAKREFADDDGKTERTQEIGARHGDERAAPRAQYLCE